MGWFPEAGNQPQRADRRSAMSEVSARPDRLRAFVTQASQVREQLDRRIAALRAPYDQFQQSGTPFTTANPDLMEVELEGFITACENDETFVDVVRAAFEAADSNHHAGLAQVDPAAFDAAFREAAAARGLDPAALPNQRASITVDEPTILGVPPTSGFVADPVCTASGHFVEVEDDL